MDDRKSFDLSSLARASADQLAELGSSFVKRYPDEARHCADVINQAVTDGHVGQWVAIRMSDGKSDGKTYDHRAQAIRAQLHEQQCSYIRVPPSGMQVPEAARWLELMREIYAAGGRLADPEMADRDVVLPETLEGFRNVLAHLRAGARVPGQRLGIVPRGRRA